MHPQQYIDQLAFVNDRLEYHPMGDTLSHVKLVVFKATHLIGDFSVIAAAWLHDIAKHPMFGGYEAIDNNGHNYWSNPDHAKQAADFITDNDDVKYAIRSFGANVDTTIEIVRAHMSVKDFVPKKYKSIPFIDMFRMCDDDINRISQTTLTRGFMGQYSHTQIYFAGLSPLDIYSGCKTFTVTIAGRILRYPITTLGDNLPELFK